MQRIVLYVLAAFIGGTALGFFVANSINRSSYTEQLSIGQPTDTVNAPRPGAAALPPGKMQADVQAVLDKAAQEPNNFAAQLAAGEMYAKIQNSEKATEFFERAAMVAPDDFDGNLAVANAFFDAREFERAGDHYQKALEFDPTNISARTDLGTTYIERPNHDFDRGIREFNEVLKIDPRHEPTLYNLGIAYFRKGDIENAKQTIARLEQVNQSSPLVARLKESIKDK